jgi:hypothetical protein
MPLKFGDLGHVEKEPLPGLVLERRLGETELHRPGRVEQHLDNLRLSTGSDLAVDSLAEVLFTQRDLVTLDSPRSPPRW